MKSASAAALCLIFLGGCATRQADHFYILTAQPPDNGNSVRAAPITPASLRVTLPQSVDRAEIVLNSSADGVSILEHARWAAPLADLVTQTLARDLERRRSDLIVSDRDSALPAQPALRIAVDIVQMMVSPGTKAVIETHWRISDSRSGKDVIGGETFSAPIDQDGYSAVAKAISDCLALLADRLTEQMR